MASSSNRVKRLSSTFWSELALMWQKYSVLRSVVDLVQAPINTSNPEDWQAKALTLLNLQRKRLESMLAEALVHQTPSDLTEEEK